MTNAGFGYSVAPTVVVGTKTATTACVTFTTVATAPTARIALYSLTLSWLSPAVAAVVSTDDAVIPANRKMNNLSLAGSGMGLNLTNNLVLFGTAPLTLTASANAPGNVLNLGGYNLLFTWNGYAGATSTYGATNTYIKNGSMTLRSKERICTGGKGSLRTRGCSCSSGTSPAAALPTCAHAGCARAIAAEQIRLYAVGGNARHHFIKVPPYVF
jgi:hypothetical protein